mmetsp:Transcript_40188/g.38675  ORF Transcript_40188/g.38675 Transcript_40188/m.38675 type:complete len:140 (+) Transcript_40188:634-1053(+)|eukprot:CAMPEP_0170559016 /NCGR_PEP_ID=MMETSP0211-20121228/39723_1 /TAXON_ID=311385 /ORGANISM="Pseudokeronopsis sp., Strain OXSARD2" /LENGTH=139 /DNA_ID=CAMNT_0010871593 /DNA_START=560 /DNA_END=979 /DNA_ORIENTATION=+
MKGGREDLVKEKRSIFRYFKSQCKFLHNESQKLQIHLDENIKNLYPKASQEFLDKVLTVLEDAALCKCKEHVEKKKDGEYISYIGDVCYKFSREAKEALFRKPEANFLFIIIMKEKYLEALKKAKGRNKKRGTLLITAY